MPNAEDKATALWIFQKAYKRIAAAPENADTLPIALAAIEEAQEKTDLSDYVLRKIYIDHARSEAQKCFDAANRLEDN